MAFILASTIPLVGIVFVLVVDVVWIRHHYQSGLVGRLLSLGLPIGALLSIAAADLFGLLVFLPSHNRVWGWYQAEVDRLSAHGCSLDRLFVTYDRVSVLSLPWLWAAGACVAAAVLLGGLWAVYRYVLSLRHRWRGDAPPKQFRLHA
ncbi:MAG TPA: hypothetical protein VFU63_03715 [Ktedonobacterales bacterium]|nr:hypothetical protein [Ktedonobacterales bacterium]